MSRSYLRLVVPIISAAVLTLGFSAPVASAADASDNTGELEGGHKRATPEQCKMYKEWYDADVKAGDKAGANYTKKLADSRGCRWAEAKRIVVEESVTDAPEPDGVNPGETSTGLESPLIVNLAPPS